MKLVSILLGAGLLLPAFGQTGVIAEGNVSGKDYAFYWQTRLEPPSPPLANSLGYGSGVNDKTGNIYRVMIDRMTRTYFGYEVRVEVLAQRNDFRVTFHPLDLSPKVLDSIHIDNPSTWTRRDVGATAARPMYPVRDAPDVVHTLDVIAVDLLVNRETKQKIVDYVVLQWPNRPWSFDLPIRRGFDSVPGNPRDFRVEDVRLTLAAPAVSVNERIEGSSRQTETGTRILVYLQNRGPYRLSLVSQPDYRKAGAVRGTSLTFTSGTDRFSIGAGIPIAPGNGAFNLYVREDAGWKPPSNQGNPEVLILATDTVAYDNAYHQ